MYALSFGTAAVVTLTAWTAAAFLHALWCQPECSGNCCWLQGALGQPAERFCSVTALSAHQAAEPVCLRIWRRCWDKSRQTMLPPYKPRLAYLGLSVFRDVLLAAGTSTTISSAALFHRSSLHSCSLTACMPLSLGTVALAGTCRLVLCHGFSQASLVLCVQLPGMLQARWNGSTCLQGSQWQCTQWFCGTTVLSSQPVTLPVRFLVWQWC